MSALTIYPISDLPEITPGAELARLILEGIHRLRLQLEPTDVVVVTQKVVSKAEGRLADLRKVIAGEEARVVAARTGFDPKHVEVILKESARVVREAHRVLITETRQGFVCANAGVDRSNAGGEHLLVLLPEDPDASAESLRQQLGQLSGAAPGIIVSDSFGRPWREGQINVAIGAAGIVCLRDYRGEQDPQGYQLQGSILAIADELASAAELVMGKLDRVPAALVRGAQVSGTETAQVLQRARDIDLFR